MHGAQEPDVEPLADHTRYEKIKSLNKGSYGFVQVSLRRVRKNLFPSLSAVCFVSPKTRGPLRKNVTFSAVGQKSSHRRIGSHQVHGGNAMRTA